MATYQEARVNPYRYGVLEGNHVEDRYGLDLVHQDHQHNWPHSTMKDEYKWYNSVLFNQRNEQTNGWPDEKAKLEKDQKLKPFFGLKVGGKKPVATVQGNIEGDNTGNSNLQDLVSSNFVNGHPSGKISIKQDDSISTSHQGIVRNCDGTKANLQTLRGELVACCGGNTKQYGPHNEQEITANLPHKGPSPVEMNVVESLHEDTQEDAITDLQAIEEANRKDSNRDPNKFTQYGGWTTEGLSDKSMYGINHSKQNQDVVKTRYEGDQEESCRSRLLMGHGLQISQFSDRDLRSTNTLSYDDKVSPQLFISPKFSVSHPKEIPINQNSSYTNPEILQKTQQSTFGINGQRSLEQSELIGGYAQSKNIHQSGLQWGSIEALNQTRHADHEYKPYENFTKEFDQTQIKTRLRTPY